MHKVNFRAMVALVALAAAMWGLEPASKRAFGAGPSALNGQANADPLRLLVVGDSITTGSTGDSTWRWFLDRHLGSSGSNVDLVGPYRAPYDFSWHASGEGWAPWPAEYADEDFDQDHAALWGDSFAEDRVGRASLMTTYAPHVVVVQLGANDLGGLGRPVPEVQESLRTWVRQTQAQIPAIDVVVCEIPINDPVITEYNASLPALAEELSTQASRVVVAKMADGWQHGDDRDEVDGSSVGMTWDLFHPNSRGQQVIAAGVADALAEIGVGASYPRPLGLVPQTAVGAPHLAGAATGAAALLTWSQPGGTNRYDVWERRVSIGTPVVGLSNWTRTARAVTGNRRPEGTTWVSSQANECSRREYRIRPRKNWSLVDWRYASNVVTVTSGPPVTTRPLPTISTPGTGARVTWNSVPAACAVRVVGTVSGPLTGTQVVTRNTSNAWLDLPSIPNGATVSLGLRGVAASGALGPEARTSSTVRRPVPRPARPKVLPRGRKVAVSWRAVATLQPRFELQTRVSKHWSAVRNVGIATSLNLRRPARGSTLQVRVRVIDGNVRGSWSSAVRIRRG